jgi:hypothetical protein
MKIKKNGKVITLTESDLNRIVKKVLSEENTVRRNTKSLRRTHLGRLSEQEKVQKKLTVENVTNLLNTTLGGGDMGVLQGTSNFISFPNRPKGEPIEGDIAVNNGECAIYKIGGNQYVAVGLIGILQGSGEKNWSVVNEEQKVFTFMAVDSSSKEGFGTLVRPIEPFPKTAPAKNKEMVIAKLIKTFVNDGRVDKNLIVKGGADTFINKMVEVLKLVGMASNIDDMDKLKNTIKNYI